MCNAYELGKRAGSFPEAIKATVAEELLGIESTTLIRRTDPAPVVTQADGLVTMRWGFERPRIGTINNSRAEKLDGRMWGSAFRDRRCLIPVAAFYEWSGPKGHKRTHRFTRPDGGWLWIAGLWEDSTEHGPCFSMITTTPNAVAEPIHHRMPAVLVDRELGRYLKGGLDEFHPPDDCTVVNDAPNPLRRPS